MLKSTNLQFKRKQISMHLFCSCRICCYTVYRSDRDGPTYVSILPAIDVSTTSSTLRWWPVSAPCSCRRCSKLPVCMHALPSSCSDQSWVATMHAYYLDLLYPEPLLFKIVINKSPVGGNPSYFLKKNNARIYMQFNFHEIKDPQH